MFTRLRPLYTTFSGLFALASLGVLIALAVVAPGIWGEQGSVIDVSGAWQPPSPAHLLGTDELGRDIFARLMSATRLSLLSAATATLLAVAIGIPLGLLAAAFGRFASRAFQSVINVAIAFPALLTAMFVGTIIGIGLPGAIAGVGIALTPIFARLTQTLTASVASLDYVAAARTMGIGRLKLVSRHIGLGAQLQPLGNRLATEQTI